MPSSHELFDRVTIVHSIGTVYDGSPLAAGHARCRGAKCDMYGAVTGVSVENRALRAVMMTDMDELPAAVEHSS